MKYKRIMILLTAAFLFLACSEGKTQKNEGVKETVITLSPSPEQRVTPPPSVTEAIQATPKATATPVPEITPDATATPVPELTPKVINPLEGAYWRELREDDNEELLTSAEIALMNRENFEAEGTGLVCLSGMEKIAPDDIVQMIESYSFLKKNYYDNEAVTDSVKGEILKNRNTEVLENAEYIEPAYGILIQNTDLRSFPAERPLTSSKNGRFDYFQETVLLMNEAVVVLHNSLDGAWCFVQAENYFGWIPEASVAYCEKACMEEWYEAMTNPENPYILLVTKNVEWKTEENLLPLRMGTKLKYDGEKGGELRVYVPTRDEGKRLQLKTYKIDPEDALYQYLHPGYLPYTRKNVISLATALLGTPYAWGDALPYSTVYSYDSKIGMDCSSTLSAVYRCFGFVMPRNTGAQRKMVWQGEETSSYGVTEKTELLQQMSAGTLMFTPGHVLMYLGEYEGEFYVLHNTTTEVMPDGSEEAFYRCVITSTRPGEEGKTILDSLLETKVPVKTDK